MCKDDEFGKQKHPDVAQRDYLQWTHTQQKPRP